jgi:hypothetical protein
MVDKIYSQCQLPRQVLMLVHSLLLFSRFYPKLINARNHKIIGCSQKTYGKFDSNHVQQIKQADTLVANGQVHSDLPFPHNPPPNCIPSSALLVLHMRLEAIGPFPNNHALQLHQLPFFRSLVQLARIHLPRVQVVV